jgi:LmbE family N-acetylglucosaminyl deacetylase
MMLATLADARDYRHVFIAPHLDDVVLSCGGQIVQYRQAGIPVLAVTICAGSPPLDGPLTPYAEHLHQTYGLGHDPMAGRRAEDRQALEILGCDGLHLDQLDAPYRLDAYGQRAAIFAPPVPDDPLGPSARQIICQLHDQQRSATLYLPLGVGSHVDHQLICQVGLALHAEGLPITWYEDAPYAVQHNLVDERLETLHGGFEPAVVPIVPALARKLEAINAYGSQVPKLFRDRPMEEVMTEYAATVGGERLWQRSH